MSYDTVEVETELKGLNNTNVFGCFFDDDQITLWINREDGGNRQSVTLNIHDFARFTQTQFTKKGDM